MDRIYKVPVRGSKTLGAKLEKHFDKVMLSRKLTGIECHVEIKNIKQNLLIEKPDIAGINELYSELGIGTALRRQAERIKDLQSQ